MSPAPSRKALPERVAAAILEGAARTLAEQGPAASMSDLAATAGVARATVYRYFPNRQVLLDELAVAALRDIADRLDAARLGEVPTHEAIGRVVRALVEVGDPFIVLAQARTRPQEFDRVIAQPVDALFQRAQQQGNVRDDLPVRWLTESLLGTVLSVLTALPRRGREDTIAAIVSLVLDGTARRGPRAL